MMRRPARPNLWLAIAVILGFVAVMALINYVEFGRVD